LRPAPAAPVDSQNGGGREPAGGDAGQVAP
jgi:hypothetical protein